MAYSLYLDGLLYPVPPSKMKVKIKNQNKTLTLMNDGEINFLKMAGLTEIQLELLLPQTNYPFAVYEGGFKGADYFLTALERLKIGKKKFQFILSRTSPNGGLLFDTNLKVSLEEYEITDDAKNGLDISVSVKLKQYRDFGTKTVVIEQPKPTQKPQATVQTARQTDSAPKKKTHTVVKGDCLWNIAQKYMGNGAKYPDLYAANQATIDGRNKGTGNPRYTIYPGQVLTIP